jgi:hypothetical protein
MEAWIDEAIIDPVYDMECSKIDHPQPLAQKAPLKHMHN